MFNNLFSKKSTPYELYVQLNDKIMPIDRGDYYEDPLISYLEENTIGNIVNSGTMQNSNGEIEYCDISIEISTTNIPKEQVISYIISYFENKGAPKGSFIQDTQTNQKINIGILEGLGLYLDGANLPDNVYKECDVNFVLSEITTKLDIASDFHRYWQGPTETALYFYSHSFDEMVSKMDSFIKSYPLCENARIVQIA